MTEKFLSLYTADEVEAFYDARYAIWRRGAGRTIPSDEMRQWADRMSPEFKWHARLIGEIADAQECGQWRDEWL